MTGISVVIITFNEEKNLGRCLESIRSVADEVVVIDSSSTDSTVAIAQEYGARVIDHPFAGYGQQKNFAVGQANHNWVLSLDADEALTPELAKNILSLKDGPQYDVYEMPRLTNTVGSGYGIVAGTRTGRPDCLTAPRGIGPNKKYMNTGRLLMPVQRRGY